MSDDEARVAKLERSVAALQKDRSLMAADLLALQSVAFGLAELVIRRATDRVQALEELRGYAGRSRSQYEAEGRLKQTYTALEEFLAMIEASALR